MARKASPPKTEDDAGAGDVALVLGGTPDGTHILRRRSPNAPLEAGLLRPLREGKPIDGELVTLKPRPSFPLLCDVKTELPDPHAREAEREPRATSDGPAQVASDAYRRGWDAVWGRGRRDRSVN